MEKLEETTASTAWYEEGPAMDGEERWKERDKEGRGGCGEEGHEGGLVPSACGGWSGARNRSRVPEWRDGCRERKTERR